MDTPDYFAIARTLALLLARVEQRHGSLLAADYLAVLLDPETKERPLSARADEILRAMLSDNPAVSLASH